MGRGGEDGNGEQQLRPGLDAVQVGALPVHLPTALLDEQTQVRRLPPVERAGLEGVDRKPADARPGPRQRCYVRKVHGRLRPPPADRLLHRRPASQAAIAVVTSAAVGSGRNSHCPAGLRSTNHACPSQTTQS